MSIRRILLMTLLLAALGCAAGLIAIRGHEAPPAHASRSWLPMPPDGMDAELRQIRILLITRSGTWNGGDGSLAWNCGANAVDEPPEEYSVHIGDSFFTANRQVWDVTVIPRGRQMEVRVSDGETPPPPPDPSTGRPVGSTADPGPTVHWVDANTMEGIREAWSNQSLWMAPQKDTDCMDGMPIALQACIHGRYVARHRGCDGASYEAAERLWSALKARFPAPTARH